MAKQPGQQPPPPPAPAVALIMMGRSSAGPAVHAASQHRSSAPPIWVHTIIRDPVGTPVQRCHQRLAVVSRTTMVPYAWSDCWLPLGGQGLYHDCPWNRDHCLPYACCRQLDIWRCKLIHNASVPCLCKRQTTLKSRCLCASVKNLHVSNRILVLKDCCLCAGSSCLRGASCQLATAHHCVSMQRGGDGCMSRHRVNLQSNLHTSWSCSQRYCALRLDTS